MGMNVASGRGPRADINITPLIDVVLVLLIIFMVFVPSTLRELTAAVPEKVESNAPPDLKPPLVLKIGAQGTLDLDGRRVEAADLPRTVMARLRRDGQRVVFFEADGEARYGVVVKVMDLVKGAGVETLAILTKD
jgi:biopolymer transport protein TolR